MYFRSYEQTFKEMLLAPIPQSIATAHACTLVVSLVVFSLISTIDVAQVPNMHHVAPKVTPVAPTTIGFPSSSPSTNGPTLVFATTFIIIPTTMVIASSSPLIPLALIPSSF